MSVSNTSPYHPEFPPENFSTAAESLGDSGRDTVPDAGGALQFGSPAGASERPIVHDAAFGQGPAAGDPGFREACQTPPGMYTAATDRSNFAG